MKNTSAVRIERVPVKWIRFARKSVLFADIAFLAFGLVCGTSNAEVLAPGPHRSIQRVSAGQYFGSAIVDTAGRDVELAADRDSFAGNGNAVWIRTAVNDGAGGLTERTLTPRASFRDLNVGNVDTEADRELLIGNGTPKRWLRHDVADPSLAAASSSLSPGDANSFASRIADMSEDGSNAADRRAQQIPMVEARIQNEQVGLGAFIDWYAPLGFEDQSVMWPLCIWLHGGGFVSQTETIDLGAEPFATFHRAGYAIAALHYTLAPSASYVTSPSMEQQCARAVQFFRANANRFNVDARRIFLFGESAGACISLVVTYGRDFANPNGTTAIDRASSRPNALLNQVGVTMWKDFLVTYNGVFFGVQHLNQASPYSMLDDASAVFLLAGGAPVIPCFSVYDQNTNPLQSPPIDQPHNPYWGIILDAALRTADPSTISELHLDGMANVSMPELVAWMDVALT